jgi:hypothetical protein
MARQAKLAKVLERGGCASGLGRNRACELLDAQTRETQCRACEHGMRKLLGVGQSTNDVGRFNTEDERRGSTAHRRFDLRGGGRDGITDPLWAGQYGFHIERCVRCLAACRALRFAAVR